MAVTVDISSESRYKFDRKLVRATVEKVLTDHGVTGQAEVSVVVVGERKMSDLNQKYLGTPMATDVLSWPLDGAVYPDETLRLGDIAVCYPVAIRQARAGNRRVDEEIAALIEHGCRHLLGLHHKES